MKIGIAIEGKVSKQLSETCEVLLIVEESKDKVERVYELVKEHLAHELYVDSIIDMDLQLVQWWKTLSLLKDNGNILHFLNKGNLDKLTDREYFSFIYELSKTERELIKTRSRAGVLAAQKKGIELGRPKISTEKIEMIQLLHKSRKRTIREIASICDVSIGTVFKYTRPENFLKKREK